MKHTPGPWEVSEVYKSGQLHSIAVHPCHFYFTGSLKYLNEADAQLIAAAPELLAACKSVQTNIKSALVHKRIHENDAEYVLNILQEVITKAEE